MKTKSIFIFMLAAAMCLYGCTETEYVYVMSDDGTSTSGTDESSGLEEVDDVCTKMTDENFKEYCYENFDANNDGKVSMKEAESVTEIDCSTAEDFTGIEYFTNLESFSSHSVKYLDLSNNIQLSYICLNYHYTSESGTEVWGNGAPIESLNLSHNVNLTELPDNAFDGCINLASVSLPESMVSIGSGAFGGCESLTSIALPKGLTTTGGAAFSGCKKLVTITLPETLTEFGAGAFNSCTNLTSVTFMGNNVTEIGYRTFIYCSSLSKVNLPDGLTSIGLCAFEYCTNLTEITLPTSLTSIGSSAFWGCDKLTSVTVKATTPPFLESNVFHSGSSSSYKASAILYVPSESIEAYKNSDWAYYFGLITATDDGFFKQDGDGTRENPYTASQAYEMVNSGTYDPDKGYYVKGYVSCRAIICTWYEGLYTIGYYMSEDGHYSWETDFFVDIGFDLGGEYFTSQDALSAGDRVIVYGRFAIDELNNDRREMACGKLYYWNGEFGELDDDEYFMERGDGSKENPYKVSQAVEMLNSGTYDPNKDYYVKGIVSWLLPNAIGIYYISEDGCCYWPETNLNVVSGYGLGGEPFSSEDVMSPLDQVIVYGKLSMNSGQPAMYDGKMYYWNGETADVEEE